tara:strand:+ start:130 stop:558 length:429 start_codon:yes stop_codon:yes gene_type:complete
MNRKLIPKIVEVANCGAAFISAKKSAGLDDGGIDSSVSDAVSLGVEKINPATLADVRALPEILQMDGMLHLLNREERRRRSGWVADWYYNELFDEPSVAATILQDESIQVVAHVLRWIEKAADQKEAKREMRCDGLVPSKIF